MSLPGYPESQHERRGWRPSSRGSRPPEHVRPALRWIMLGSLLLVTGSLASLLAHEHRLVLHHSVLGAALLLITLGGLVCYGMAALSWLWGSRNARGRRAH